MCIRDRPTAGIYRLDGVDVQSASRDEMSEVRNKKIGFVFQNFNLIGRTTAPVSYTHLDSAKKRISTGSHRRYNSSGRFARAMGEMEPSAPSKKCCRPTAHMGSLQMG